MEAEGCKTGFKDGSAVKTRDYRKAPLGHDSAVSSAY